MCGVLCGVRRGVVVSCRVLCGVVLCAVWCVLVSCSVVGMFDSSPVLLFSTNAILEQFVSYLAGLFSAR